MAVLALVLAMHMACGSEEEPPAPPPTAPEWAKVSPKQIAEAERLGVPVAFENGIGMRFVLIPAGKFLMGAREDEEGRFEEEGPQHEVTLSAFYLAVTEVTNGQYRRFRPDHDSGEWEGRSFDGDDQPVVEVSHEDATAFLRWLFEREGGAAYRLPSEAEWEYACRAGTTTRYWSGNTEEDLERVGWYFRNSGVRLLPRDTEWDTSRARGEWACRSQPVGGKPPNPWGLYDMHGNVLEWCEDTFHYSYDGAPTDGSAWVEGGSGHRVNRSGSWDGDARLTRSACRYRFSPWGSVFILGFRPGREVVREEE